MGILSVLLCKVMSVTQRKESSGIRQKLMRADAWELEIGREGDDYQ